MVNILGPEAMLHISFGMAAFIFGVVLYALVCALGTGQVHKNLKFRTLIITIVIGDFISILDNIFRDSGKFDTPAALQLLLLLLVYQANILLTYYMACYMEGFFEDFKIKKFFVYFNTIVVISSVLFTATIFIVRLIIYQGDAIYESVPIWVRVVLGYVYEVYYLVYSLTLFIVFSKTLSKRARITSISAFAVVIGSVLFELVNTFGIGSGIMYNYFGAVIGLYIFYIGVETPDYQNLLSTVTDLDEARKAADEANQAKSDFLANMSHEIRTPINAVLGMNEMIQREADGDILVYSDNIKNAGTTLLGLINDILDFSKIEAGKIEIVPTEYDITSVINDLVNMVYNRAEEKGILLKLDFDRSLPKILWGDEVRIKQVITNILTNAVKYTETGSVTLSIGYEPVENEPDCVLVNVAVKDTGVGIKEEDLPKLFLEFERLDEKRNRNIEGTGLGMSITHSLLRLMGSSLSVDSTYGEGSTFSFSLKQKVISWEELGDFEAAYNKSQTERHRHEERFSAPDARVLVVDDNNMNLVVFKSLIKGTLIRIDTAESGDEGLELAAQYKYDIIFLDHMMPQKDGIETLQELRATTDGPNLTTTTVCLTANAISGAKEKYLDAGFDDYLTKPIDPNALEAMLLEYLPKEKIKEAVAKDENNVNESVDDTPETLKSLEECGIDIEKGIENNGSKEDYLVILKMFFETLDERISEIQAYFEENDWEDYTVKVHALKSSLRIIGATELGEEAQLLENAGKDEDIEYIKNNHFGFVDRCTALNTAIEAVLSDQKKSETTLKVIDDQLLSEVYAEIKDAAGEGDADRIESMIDEMRDYRVPESEKDIWEQISSSFEVGDYEKILSVLSEK